MQGVHTYRYGGRTIDSSWELPGLETESSLARDSAPAEGRIVLQKFVVDRAAPRELQLGWPGRFGLTLFASGERWIFALCTGAEFWVDRTGGVIGCDPGTAGWSEATAEGFVRRVLPRVVQMGDCVVLHAVAMRSPAGAVLLCGKSGAGKSTLGAGLHETLGWDILADDMSVLRPMSDRILLFPTGCGASLWQDAKTAFPDSRAQAERIEIYGTKYRWRPAAGLRSDPVPLVSIYHLDRKPPPMNETITIAETDVRFRLNHLMRAAIRFNPADRTLEHVQFPVWLRVAREVPMWELRFDSRFDLLPEVAMRLAAQVVK